MMKNFDLWNINKKNIHIENGNKLYHTREIWWCLLGINIGFEQDGTGKDSNRPVLVLKGFSKNVCLVIPLTTSTKNNPYHVSLGDIGGKNAFAIISQIRLIDTKRLVDKVCTLDSITFDKIRKAVKDIL
jgi:mRNA-degrading endonuclease toxin of MazEF toxin-antitoxin module